MIPAIGTMIAAYIGFRMLEIFAFPDSRYSSKTANVVLAILALLVMLIVGVCWVSLITSGTSTPQP